MILFTLGGQVPKRQAEALVSDISQDFEAFYEREAAHEPEATRDPLVMSLDGKGIVMRRESLRPQTRKAAERSQHKLKTRLSSGEKRDRKRLATVATVYTIASHLRTAEAIMNVTPLEEETQLKPRPRHKRLWASVSRDAQTVTDEVFEEAQRRDPKPKRPWVMLLDGQPQQLAQVKNSSAHYGVEVTLILDFIHVLEYLWKAAYCFHSPGT